MRAQRLANWLWRRWVRSYIWLHQPDQVIGGREDPYLLRWYVIPRNPLFNIYIHKFLRSDDDRALHDHPWPSLSLALYGEMFERTRRSNRDVIPGDMIYRSASHAHRLEVPQNGTAVTLFVTGPRIREWGFHCPQGWRHWKDFVDPTDSGKAGRGCE